MSASTIPRGSQQCAWGARERDGKLEEAVSAYSEALKELTKETSPPWHDMGQRNLHRASAQLAQRLKK